MASSKKNMVIKGDRTGRPAFLRMQPQCSWIWLQDKAKRMRPVKAWAHRTASGWTGWLAQFKEADDGLRQVLPTNWASDKWDEVDPASGTKSGDVEVSVVSVNTKKGRKGG